MTITSYPLGPISTEASISAPWYAQVSRGLVPGASIINIYGYTNNAATAGFAAAWEGAPTAYTFPAAAGVPVYASTSAETLTMLVSGLDASYAPITDTVTFSGGTTGTAAGGKSFFRINDTTLLTGTNVGTITTKIAGTTYAQINPGIGKAQMSVYSVAAGYTFYILRTQAYANNNGTQYSTYRVQAQVATTGPTVVVLNSPFTAFYQSTRVAPRPYPEKTDLQWQIQNSQANNAVGFQIEGLLMSNTAP